MNSRKIGFLRLAGYKVNLFVDLMIELVYFFNIKIRGEYGYELA